MKSLQCNKKKPKEMSKHWAKLYSAWCTQTQCPPPPPRRQLPSSTDLMGSVVKRLFTLLQFGVHMKGHCHSRASPGVTSNLPYITLLLGPTSLSAHAASPSTTPVSDDGKSIPCHVLPPASKHHFRVPFAGPHL